MEACRALGIIPPTFPSVGSTATDSWGLEDENNADKCNCPIREKSPPLPTSLPLPPTEENRDKLEKWLLDYYRSSTFNVCTHQPLPSMTGPLMSLMIEDTKPVSHHTAIPVPIHWQE
ncbi:hypothetical protein ElyMa_004730100 [Elysia marginata]|uniref:Uncharacterized protein n=1 Tax=Elysia marginata TaxID=1093978 RepID=A0AAV4IGT2_9GAST|nr:hypothetical protein ElyMa_004730100 [Elysia marginata]